MFIFVFVFMYCLGEKYFKPITLQYYIANCDSWVLKLTLLYLKTTWTYKFALGTEFVCMYGTYCTGFALRVFITFGHLASYDEGTHLHHCMGQLTLFGGNLVMDKLIL